MLKLRLQRHGRTHKPFYHIVATDSRKPRDGRFKEKLGYYNPNSDPSEIVVNTDRVQYWYQNGAQLTDRVAELLRKQKVELSRKASK